MPLEKFLNLTDDIFEADDNISPDGEISSLEDNFFSPLSTDPTKPLLHPDVIIKLTKAISKVARPTRRLRLASGQWDGVTPGSPRKAAGMAEVEVQTLSRLLKLLERSVQAGEDLDPFKSASGIVGSNRLSEQEKLESIGEALTGADAGISTVDLAAEDFELLEKSLELARQSVLAANCCLALLTSDRLAKQVRYAVIAASDVYVTNELTHCNSYSPKTSSCRV